jgi:glycosyltransferase involved in cell wall biosynthesis
VNAVNDLTVIVLTYNESIHIRRCINSVSVLNCRIVVVDSFSTDETVLLASASGADIYQNSFVNQSVQFQWAMSNCQINSKWVLRLDADETIDADLVGFVKDFVASDGYGHNGAVLLRKHIFLGRWIRHGGRYPLPMLRLFRNGCAHVEQKWMDEHIVLDHGTSTILAGGFEDNNLNTVGWFIDKHNKYATRETVDIKLKQLYPMLSGSGISKGTGYAIRLKRLLKDKVYLSLPYFIRPFLYFMYRYFVQLGFLDGASGFAYHFMQGFWYRALVDLKCLEIDLVWQSCNGIEEKHKALEEYSGYLLDRPNQ